MIDEVQPYRAGTRPRAEDQALAHLNRFSNTDKHRLLHPLFGKLESVTVEPVGGSIRIEMVPADPLPLLMEGAEVYRMRLSEPSHPDVKVKARITFAMVFGRYHLHSGNFRRIHRDVVGIIDRFRPSFD